MTSSNLAIVFAPCLLPPPNKTEMSEGRLELRVLLLRTFIENPHLFGNKPVTLCSPCTVIKCILMYCHVMIFLLCLPGVIPKSVMDSMGFLMNFNFLKHAHSKKLSHRKRHSCKGKLQKFFLTSQRNPMQKMSLSKNSIRHKMELDQPAVFDQMHIVVQSLKTLSWIQGRSKVTAPVSEQSQGSTSGDKPSLRRSLGLENFPSILLFRTYMPCAGKHKVKKVTSYNGWKFSI